MAIRPSIKRGTVREAFCAHWCVDAVFAVSGTVTSFALYHYDFMPFLKVRNLLMMLMYVAVTALFVLLAPSGHSLFTKKRAVSEEKLLLAEYRFNDTLCMVRNFFLALLFGIPILLILLSQSRIQSSLFHTWSEAQICGGFCFAAFLILLPISLRQAFFWLKALVGTPAEEEAFALKQYSMRLHYKHRNRRL